MKNAPFLHAVEYFAFRRFRNHLMRRSHQEVRELGAKVGGWAYGLLKSPRKKALGNLERVFPEKSADEREQIARDCFRHFGSQFFESLSIERFETSNILDQFDLEGWEILEELQAQEKGYFLHTGHYGSFEMALYPCGMLLDGYHGVVRPLDNPRINADLLAVRGKFGARILSKAGVALKMRSAVRNGNPVAIIIDQHVRPSAGVKVPFLGHPAWTSNLLASLAIKMKVPVVPFACLPIDGGRYRLEIRPPIWADDTIEDRAEAVLDLTSRIMAEVEKDIHRRPEWWLWMHRRWRDGDAPSKG